MLTILEKLQNENPMLENRQAMLDSIKTNLENLLNCKKSRFNFSSRLSELSSSALNYGINDFSGAYFDINYLTKSFCQELKLSILTFEPRIKQVLVEISPDINAESRTIRLNISGLVIRNHQAEKIAFSSIYKPTSHHFSVSTALDGHIDHE